MQTQVASLLRSINRDTINILCSPTHERYESAFAGINANFYAIKTPQTKDWNEDFAKKPNNYHIYELNNLPRHIGFDLVLSQNKFGQFQFLSQFATKMGLPLISIEHTCPMPSWDQKRMIQCRQMEGDANIFITNWQIEPWGFQNCQSVEVIDHCVDTNIFLPSSNKRLNHILTVANDYIGRDYCLNFSQYKRITQGLPTFPVGETKNFSRPAKDINDLVDVYQKSKIFLNTAHLSPIPTSLLEAMACGCAVISCATCAIPNYIKHGVNGFLYTNDNEARHYLELLLSDDELAQQVGQKARETIQEQCSVDKFVTKYNNLFQRMVLK